MGWRSLVIPCCGEEQSLRQTTSQKEKLEQAGIVDVTNNHLGILSLGQKKNGAVDFPISAMQREGHKKTHHLGQKQVHMEDKEVQSSQWTISAPVIKLSSGLPFQIIDNCTQFFVTERLYLLR